jgi:integrase
MKAAFPLEIKRGNASVKIYKRFKNGYEEFRIAYYDLDGRRKLQSFSSLQAAKDEAAVKATSISTGDFTGLSLSGEDRLCYLRALDVLKPLNVPLEMAVMQFVEAAKSLNGTGSVVEAARFYAKRHTANAPVRTVKEVCDEMIKAKKADGLSRRHTKDLQNRCEAFANAHACQISQLTEAEISQWLRALNVSNRTRNNYRMSIVTLIGFAVAQRYISRDLINVEDIARAKQQPGTIEIFTPAQIGGLLRAADKELLPFVAIGAFAGLRSSEIQRLNWSQVDFRGRHITVFGRKGTAGRRIVPFLENLSEWLKPVAQSEGPVCRWKNLQRPIADLEKASGIEWKTNALRHSFISYRVAQVQNAAQVALEAGNSPQMIFRHYRELVRPDEALAWFSIEPG